MDEFSVISGHSRLLQGPDMLGARDSPGVLSSGGSNAVPTQDGRKNKRKDAFYCDWPELIVLDDSETSPRGGFDPMFEIGSDYFKDELWPSIYSPESQPARSRCFDDSDLFDDRNESTTPETNSTKTKQQPRRNGASDTPLSYDAHANSSSSLSDADLFLPFEDMALASQIGGCCEGLEAILCTSPEVPVPAASNTMCSDGTALPSTCSVPDFAAPQAPRPAKKPQDPFRGAPDAILEEMTENPLDVYFPPLATYEQPEMLVSDAASAPKHRFPEEFAGSCALSCAELQFSSKDMPRAGFHGQPGSSKVRDVVAVKDLGFHKLQDGMNQVDLETRGRIRDALYRLANNVEQRHCVASTSGGMLSSGSKRLKSGRWTEPQTNPMDRSVAQLLLQKPSYRKNVPPHRVTYSPIHHIP